MKCLTFLLVILCVSLVNSLQVTTDSPLIVDSALTTDSAPNNDSTPTAEEQLIQFFDFLGILFGEQSNSTSENSTSIFGSENSEVSTSEDPTTTTTTTTEEPEDLSNYTLTDLQDKVEARFNDLRAEFIDGQQWFINEINAELDEHKLSISNFFDLLQNKYSREVTEIDEKLKQLESKKAAIEESIKQIQESSSSKTENTEKIERLNQRKKILQNIKVEGCAECHGFLDEYTINDELQNVDKQIAELVNKPDVDQDRKKLGNSKEAEILNSKYLELINIYKVEVNERERRGNLSVINQIIQEKMINHTEFMELSLYEQINSIKNFTEHLFDIDQLKSNSTDDGGNCKLKPFEWRKLIDKSDTKQNGVLSGIDLDGSELYVARKEYFSETLYGKVALRPARNDAYVTSDSSEKAVDDYEILTAKNYKWCKSESYKLPDDMPPICRAKKEGSNVPGTLIEGGICRIGFGFNVIKYTKDFEILSFNNCKKSCMSSLKIWF